MHIARMLLPLLCLIALTPTDVARAAACEQECGTDTHRIIERRADRTEVIIRNGSGVSISEVCKAGIESGRWISGGKTLSLSECVTRTLVRECERWKSRGYSWPSTTTNCETQDSLNRMHQQARTMGARADELYIRVRMFPQHVPTATAPAATPAPPPLPIPSPLPEPAAPPAPEVVEVGALTSLETLAAGIAANVAEIRTTLSTWDPVPKDDRTNLEQVAAYTALALCAILAVTLVVLLVQFVTAARTLSKIGHDVATIKELNIDEVAQTRPRR